MAGTSRRRLFWGFGMSPIQRGVVLLVAALAFASVEASPVPHLAQRPDLPDHCRLLAGHRRGPLPGDTQR